MTNLNEDQRRQLADHIATRLEELEKEIKYLTFLTQPIAPDRSIGRLTRLEALNELAVNEKALVSARARRLKLQAVQGQLHEPEFGCCRSCDEPIPFARLLTLPETKLCVTCAEQAEHRSH